MEVEGKFSPVDVINAANAKSPKSIKACKLSEGVSGRWKH